MAPIAKLFVEVGSNITGFQRGMNQVDNQIKQTANQANILTNAISTGVGMLAVQAVNKLQTSISDFVESGKFFNSLEENASMAFETMLGGADKAREMLDSLRTFAEKTPFELPGLITISQKLKAFGFETQKIIPMLTSIGNATAGLGGSPELLNRITTALGQIRAKGKIQAQEMMQLTEAGIPAWEILAKKIGVSIPEAMKLSEKGAIKADIAISGILEGLDLRFGGLMEKQSKSFTGLTSNFNDVMRSLAAQVTKPWFENAKKGLARMLEIMSSDKFKAFFAQIVKGSEKAANFVAMLKGKLFDLVGKGINLFSGLFGNVQQSNKAIGILDVIPNKLKSIYKFLQPIGSFLYNTLDKGFRFVTGAFDNFYRSFNKISNQRFYFFGDMSMEQFGKGVVSIFNDINNGGKNLQYWLYQAPKVFQVITRLLMSAKGIFNYIGSEGLQKTLKNLGRVFTGLGTILSKLVRPFKEALGGLFQQLSTMKNLGFADIFSAVLSSIAKAFTEFLKVIQTEFWPTIKGAIVWVWNALGSFLSSIDWGGLWSTISTSFTAIIDFVKSIDWSNVWSVIWSGLSAVGNILLDYVIKPLGDLFDYLVSWFSDTTKNSTLVNILKSTWSFVAEWAGYLWEWISPRLNSFFSYLSSWFTDPSKQSQLYNGLIATWTFVSDWALSIWGAISPTLSTVASAIYDWVTNPATASNLWSGIQTAWNFITKWGSELWNWVSPYLSSFGSNLYNWITNPSTASNLYAGIVASWNFITTWASNLWLWASPYLSSFWTYLTSWITDPNKRQSMYNGLVSTWNGFTLWATNLWAWISPSLSTMATNLKAWIDTNYPNLGSWLTSLQNFSNQSAVDFEKNFPRMSKAISDMVNTIKTEFPLIGAEIGKLYKTLFGEDNSTFMDYVTFAIENVTNKISSLVKQFRLVLEMINLINEGWKKVFSGDFQGFADLRLNFDNLAGQLMEAFTAPSIPLPSNPVPQSNVLTLPGHARGGNIVKSGYKIVGEKGKEIVKLNQGDRVFDHGQSMGMMGGKSGGRFDLYIHNESKIAIDRATVKEIAQYLDRELNLRGNRVVFAS